MIDVFAAQDVRNETESVRDDTRDSATGPTAASGLRQTMRSSRRQRDGLRQRGLRRAEDSATERTSTAVRYIDGLRCGWRAATTLRKAVVSDHPVPRAGSNRGHTAASGFCPATLSSLRQRYGLLQPGVIASLRTNRRARDAKSRIEDS